MDQPPPYEKHSIIPAPTFHIRQATPSDGAALARLDEHMIAKSPRANRETPATLAVMKSSVRDPSVQNLVQIVAIPIAQPTRSGSTSFVQKFKNYTIDKVPKAGDIKGKSLDITAGIGILGYAVLLPYTDGVGGSVKIYDRTARLNISSIEESVVGEEMFWNINRALVDEAMERSREQGDRYKTVLTSMTFSDREPSLVRWRDLMIDRGFVQVGCFKGVIEKWGKIMDRIYLQKDVEVEAVERESDWEGKMPEELKRERNIGMK